MNSNFKKDKSGFRALLERGGIAGASILGAFCPICIPAIGAFLASIGLGFMINVQVLQGLMVFCLIVALLGLGFSYLKEHRQIGPLVLGVIGTTGIYGGRYLFALMPLIYLGVAAFIFASIWNWRLRKAKKSEVLRPCCAAKVTSNQQTKEKKQMTTKRKIEVFTEGCPKCEDAVSLVKSLACDNCEVTVFDVKAGCETNECREKATQYGLTQYPAIVVNGKLLDCCTPGKTPDRETLVAAGVGAA